MDRDLGGTWRAAAAEEDLRRRFVSADLDDSGWTELTVPGHWQRHPALAEEQGPVLHRRSFEHPVPDPGRRSWLCLDGVFYQSDVWLDGTLLGDTEGYFVPHQFDVTAPLATAERHLLALGVTCAPQRQKARKRNITGVFQHWDEYDPDRNPGGIWQGVRIEESGPVRIVHRRVLCTDAHRDLATVAIRLVLDSDEDRDVTLRTEVAGTTVTAEHHLASGENQVSWTLGVEQPALWWPRALGDQPLHDLTVTVLVEGEPSDVLHRRIGFRAVETRNWITRVNGERLFLKGANQGPTDYWLAEATGADHRRIVELALEAGLDMIRLQAHVSSPELYDAADEAGLLVWQDFPLQWGYHPSVRRQAARQAREMVDLLGHHPSVALWCAHHEPMAIDPSPARLADRRERRRLIARAAVAQQLPAYNRTVIDRSVSRAIHRCDPSRPIVSHAGGLPNLAGIKGTDTHAFLGWFGGEERSFPRLVAALPRLARFVGSFGAQAPATDFAACHGDGWPALDWSELGLRLGLQKGAFDRYVPPLAYDTPDDWVVAAQNYQARVVRYHVETLRRLKYRPSGGFAVLGLADAAEGVTFSLVDHRRNPKAAFEALRDACRPILLIADRPPSHLHPGDELVLDVHVVSDLRSPRRGLRSEGRVRWDGGEHVQRWVGDVAADDVALVGTLRMTVPEVEATLEIELVLEVDGQRVVSRYGTRVVRHSGGEVHR